MLAIALHAHIAFVIVCLAVNSLLLLDITNLFTGCPTFLAEKASRTKLINSAGTQKPRAFWSAGGLLLAVGTSYMIPTMYRDIDSLYLGTL